MMGEDKLGGCLYEEGYDKILTKRLSFERSFNIPKYMIKYLLKLTKKDFTTQKVEGEALRILIKSALKQYKVKHRKYLSEKCYKGLKIAHFRLKYDAMVEKFFFS